MSAMDVAGTQGVSLQIAELVEHEKRVVAGTSEMAVVGRAFLITVGRAHTGIHVDDDHPRRMQHMYAVDPLPLSYRACSSNCRWVSLPQYLVR